MTRLTILLGAGGVGKTTLASALALAHARAGARTALLGVDPARRLRTALGVPDVPEEGVAVPVAAAGSLDAALLDPSACLRRWVADACADPAERARLVASPYFVALADRLAGFTDAIGCARAVEWVERDPHLAELVLDTAPGVAAVELLARPEKLLAFFDGRLVRWLVQFARLGRGRGRMLAGLAELAGAAALRDIGRLVAALDGAIAVWIERLERARAWLAAPETSLVIACGISDRGADAARAVADAVRFAGFSPALYVANRVLPPSAAAWSPSLADAPPAAVAFARYVRAYVRAQDRVRAELAADGSPVLDVPDSAILDSSDRLAGLAALGEPLREAVDRAAAARAA